MCSGRYAVVGNNSIGLCGATKYRQRWKESQRFVADCVQVWEIFESRCDLMSGRCGFKIRECRKQLYVQLVLDLGVFSQEIARPRKG